MTLGGAGWMGAELTGHSKWREIQVGSEFGWNREWFCQHLYFKVILMDFPACVCCGVFPRIITFRFYLLSGIDFPISHLLSWTVSSTHLDTFTFSSRYADNFFGGLARPFLMSRYFVFFTFCWGFEFFWHFWRDYVFVNFDGYFGLDLDKLNITIWMNCFGLKTLASKSSD